MIKYFLEMFFFEGDGLATGGFEFVARGAVTGKAAFDDYDVAIEVGFEGVAAAVKNFDDDDCGSRSPLVSTTTTKGECSTVGHV